MCRVIEWILVIVWGVVCVFDLFVLIFWGFWWVWVYLRGVLLGVTTWGAWGGFDLVGFLL